MPPSAAVDFVLYMLSTLPWLAVDALYQKVVDDLCAAGRRATVDFTAIIQSRRP